MKNKAIAILMTAFLLGSTIIGCNQKYDEVATKQEQTIKKQSKEEGKAKKQNKDSLVSDTKKDSKLAKEEPTKKEKGNNPKESNDKKENSEQKQGKENKTESAKSQSKPTENKKPSSNSTTKPASRPETKPQNNSTPKPQHIHNWVAQTHTVDHAAITHKETVVIEEAWDEEVLAGYWSCCNVCGADITGNEYEHEKQHALNYEGGGHHLEVKWETVHHPAVTEERVVVDKEAWTETVVDGYKCSCGATK